MKNLKTKKTLMVLITLLLCAVFPMGLPTSWADEVNHITMEAVKALIEKGDKGILVVDVQPAGVYKTGHIKGAINFPWEPDLKSSGSLPKDKMLILYCDCAHEEDSIDTAAQLRDKFGYTNTKVLEGGWTKWMTQGYPTEK
jgi:rhodanese-related sulfurtransferase